MVACAFLKDPESPMHLRHFCTILGLALFTTATTANAAVHRVFPGESIQAAIDAASPGDSILVEPGTYQEPGNALYGLHITTDNLRLVGKVRKKLGEAGKVRILHTGTQQTGIYAAPPDPGCDYDDRDGSCPSELQGFYVRGFTVEGFPKNGIQTRWVDGFKFIRNESVNNLNNGIYPTLSANGLVQKNISYGSLDTAMWVAGSSHVRVIDNELFDSVIGFEITVSNDVEFKQNEVYNNTVGIGLFHPNGAGNPPLPVMADWVITHNDVYDNNRDNDAPPGSFQKDLPKGVGILMLGVSDHVVSKNRVDDNGFVGIGLLGWCTATLGTNNSCDKKPPITPSTADNNEISRNRLSNNGGSPPGGPLDFLAADLTFFDVPLDGSSGNCFKKNRGGKAGLTTFSSDPSGELPTDGC